MSQHWAGIHGLHVSFYQPQALQLSITKLAVLSLLGYSKDESKEDKSTDKGSGKERWVNLSREAPQGPLLIFVTDVSFSLGSCCTGHSHADLSLSVATLLVSHSSLYE